MDKRKIGLAFVAAIAISASGMSAPAEARGGYGYYGGYTPAYDGYPPGYYQDYSETFFPRSYRTYHRYRRIFPPAVVYSHGIFVRP